MFNSLTSKFTLHSLISLSTKRQFTQTIPKMSQEYLVTVFDVPNADRSKVRPQHVKDIPANVPNPIRSAGAIYTDESKSKFAGSSFHLVANSKDEIYDFLKKDIYAREGIWDLNNVQIFPIGVAVRLPKKMDGVDESAYKI
ncbi:uncharacterized protein KGF55_002463 [Candida pseudojiufengensis]|uniref:uncharacterized protein n=1 Tax=Candida pseudojiufengensis TaxID=497109 RepID=UPI0022259126|nr:uncharacterized protein KGF55_002463 [Candida pseudojiufengensis]KAI5963583.1 hypothetical protein KGF55_002463 [Candida pseudojiufengensis]